MTDWVPVVDISRHQGAVDFAKMKTKGVRGLILRVSHGLTLDDRVETYYPQAVDAGFAPADIGFYPFINPKRSSGADAAEFAVEAILRITGGLDFFYMPDVENYANETPNAGQAPVFGSQFADHIREHIGTVEDLAPSARIFGYSNRAYWNGKIYKGSKIEWVGDDELAASLEWDVARYPVYSLAGYVAKPLPDDPSGWDEWAFKTAPDGPFPPRGASWQAWQFSAGFNRQGPAYGVSSSDLDLNIVHPDAWARWTGKTAPDPPPFQPPTVGDLDMALIITNDAEHDGHGPGAQHWLMMDDGTKRELDVVEKAVRGNTLSERVGNAQLDLIPDWVAPGAAIVDQVARDDAKTALEAGERNARALSDVRMGAQRIADAGGH